MSAAAAATVAPRAGGSLAPEEQGYREGCPECGLLRPAAPGRAEVLSGVPGGRMTGTWPLDWPRGHEGRAGQRGWGGPVPGGV